MSKQPTTRKGRQPHKVALPEGTNPLHQAVVYKMKTICKKRGLTIDTMAKQLGVKPNLIRRIYRHGELPSPELARRFVLWAWEKVDFSTARSLRVREWYRYESGKAQWKWVKIPIPKKLYQRLLTHCQQTGFSFYTFALVALEYVASGHPPVTTLRAAIERAEAALLPELFLTNPYLLDIINGDLRLADMVWQNEETKRPGAKEGQVSVHEYPRHIHQIAEKPVEDGPATSISQLWRDRFEEL